MRLFCIIIVSMLLAAAARADDGAAEIEYLVTAIGASGCAFIRNGKQYDAADAEAHLRMKYNRGRRYASTAEQFIERLASASFLSGKPYFIQCAADDPVPAGTWLRRRLNELRNRDISTGAVSEQVFDTT